MKRPWVYMSSPSRSPLPPPFPPAPSRSSQSTRSELLCCNIKLGLAYRSLRKKVLEHLGKMTTDLSLRSILFYGKQIGKQQSWELSLMVKQFLKYESISTDNVIYEGQSSLSFNDWSMLHPLEREKFCPFVKSRGKCYMLLLSLSLPRSKNIKYRWKQSHSSQSEYVSSIISAGSCWSFLLQDF